MSDQNSDKKPIGETVGVISSVIDNINRYESNVILNSSKGHGFAAEKANHLNDLYRGKNAKIIGGDNKKNGADRWVNGQNIQTKYCSSGSKCIAECFDDFGKFRYLNENGTPMNIEVPSDKFEAAVQSMEDRIRKGQIPGVSDPNRAKEIIKKGDYSYQQALNIAKAGTIDSIKYDAMNGIIFSGKAMGISSAITFAYSIWNGEEYDVALRQSISAGLKTFGVSFVTGIITAQIGRTGVEMFLRPATDAIVKKIGYDAASKIALGVSNKAISGIAAANHVSKLLRGNIVTGAVTTLVLSSVDIGRLINGRISGKQLFKNVTNTAIGVAGGTAGWAAGAALGATVGSVIPGIGTAVGGVLGFLGGLAGAAIGGTAASSASKMILDGLIGDDAEEMITIFNGVFENLAVDHLMSKDEIEKVIDNITGRDMPSVLRDMFASKNRELFASQFLTREIQNITQKREVVQLPSPSHLNDMILSMIETEEINEIIEMEKYARKFGLENEKTAIDLLEQYQEVFFISETAATRLDILTSNLETFVDEKRRETAVRNITCVFKRICSLASFELSQAKKVVDQGDTRTLESTKELLDTLVHMNFKTNDAQKIVEEVRLREQKHCKIAETVGWSNYNKGELANLKHFMNRLAKSWDFERRNSRNRILRSFSLTVMHIFLILSGILLGFAVQYQRNIDAVLQFTVSGILISFVILTYSAVRNMLQKRAWLELTNNGKHSMQNSIVDFDSNSLTINGEVFNMIEVYNDKKKRMAMNYQNRRGKNVIKQFLKKTLIAIAGVIVVFAIGIFGGFDLFILSSIIYIIFFVALIFKNSKEREMWKETHRLHQPKPRNS